MLIRNKKKPTGISLKKFKEHKKFGSVQQALIAFLSFKEREHTIDKKIDSETTRDNI